MVEMVWTQVGSRSIYGAGGGGGATAVGGTGTGR